jgi:hypothetical protein
MSQVEGTPGLPESKSEIRSTKSETNQNTQSRKPKQKKPKRGGFELCVIWSFEIVSTFESQV